MYRILSLLVLVSISLTFNTLHGEELGELEFEEIPSSGIIVDDPSASVLVIESTVKALQFNSRAGIRKVVEPKVGTYHVFLPPGVHIIEVNSEGYLPLKLPRRNFQPKSAKKFRVRSKAIFGGADQFNAERPTLRLNYTANSGEETYVKLDDDPPQRVDFSAGSITLRPAPGDHDVMVYAGSLVWQQRFTMESRGQYEATVEPSASGAGALNIEAPGNIFVDSNPQGATVLLNQVEQKGQTPLTINDVQPGLYQIDLVLPQHQPAQRQIEVKSLEYAQAVVELVPTYGALTIDSEPSGSVLYFGDEQVGTTPYRARRDAGLYQLRLVQPFYHDEVDTLTVEVGAVIDTVYALRPRFGQLLIRSNPSGAQVTMDGNFIGTTPLKQDRVSSGSHMLEVTLAPYETLRRSITMTDEAVDTLSFDLLNTVGRLGIKSKPSGARVAIKETGKELGTTPLSDIELSEGGYTLVLSLAKHDTLERPVQLQRGQETNVEVDLVRHRGNIRVESTPPRAQIMVDGKDYGQTPQIIQDLPTDTYSVRLQLDGYDPSVAQIDVKKNQMTDHKVELTTQGVQAWKKRKGRARILALVPGMGLGQLIGPGQRLRGLLYGVGMGGALAMAYSADQSYAQARADYDAALQRYTSAVIQSDIDRQYDASVDASNRMSSQADQFKLALTGAGAVYAIQLIDALLFGGGDVQAKQAFVVQPILQVSEQTPGFQLKWQF